VKGGEVGAAAAWAAAAAGARAEFEAEGCLGRG